MNLTYEQIDKEFQRQVRLCRGLGKNRMQQIVAEQFSGAAGTKALKSSVQKALFDELAQSRIRGSDE